MPDPDSSSRPFSWRRLYDAPWLLFFMAPLFWSGNFVLGRAVAGEIPPVGLAFWRWTVGCLIVLPFAWPHLRRDLREFVRRWPTVLVLSAAGIAGFNTFVYIGLQDTTALNAVMMQSTMPIAIVAASFLLFGERVGPLQGLGILVSLSGVGVIVARGDWGTLAGLAFNRGDLWILAAVVSYALYTALLRRRPVVHPLSLLAGTFGLGAVMLLPLLAWEMASGRVMPATPAAFGAVAYVAVFPSVLAYFCFNRTVELIGANRTGLSVHLMPVFGTLMAIAFLGESLRWYHGAGVALIAAGIVLAGRRR
ncbi:DMT family transporter [Arenibaculum sp.]|uniref:DMT family transporter n=1 Tax=Arenibaculum sp. TaxID=2865862 RepID=UPI002E0FB06B|nr:DMT family transporter [Arenibaculum sp.]